MSLVTIQFVIILSCIALIQFFMGWAVASGPFFYPICEICNKYLTQTRVHETLYLKAYSRDSSLGQLSMLLWIGEFYQADAQ